MPVHFLAEARGQNYYADTSFCHTTGNTNALCKAVTLRGLSLRDGLAMKAKQNLRVCSKGEMRHAKSMFSKVVIDGSKKGYVQLVITNSAY